MSFSGPSGPRRNLDVVVGEFSPHNLPLQAVLGLIGIGDRITTTLERLSTQELPTVEPGQHHLDLALLGLLGLHEALLDQLAQHGLAPTLPEPQPPNSEFEPEVDALRRLLR